MYAGVPRMAPVRVSRESRPSRKRFDESAGCGAATRLARGSDNQDACALGEAAVPLGA